MFTFSDDEKRSIVSFMVTGVSLKERDELIEAFEGKFSNYLGVNFTISFSSGTTSLIATISALDLNSSDEVIIPALSFISPLSSVIINGAVPVLCDIDDKSFNLDIDKARKLITSRTRAIIGVHLYGVPMNIPAWLDLKNDFPDIIFIEDCAQACGSSYQGKLVGNYGDISCFSFFHPKNLNCFGGGAVATNDPIMASRLRKIRDYGSIGQENRDFDECGINSSLTEFQAIIGTHRLALIAQHLASLLERSDHIRQMGFPIQYQECSDTEAKPVSYMLAGLINPSQKNLFRESMVLSLAPLPALNKTTLYRNIYGDRTSKFPIASEIADRLIAFRLNPEIQIDVFNNTLSELKKEAF